MKQAQFALLIIFSLFSTADCLWGQCSLPRSVPIPAQGNNHGYIRVSNAINDDLSSPSQGVCAIKVRFSHQSVGDIRLILSSPNGSQYSLIQSRGSRITSGTIWDITLVRCSTPANPDPGRFLKPVWDSDQDWGQDQNYSGSYHAQTCLEDIAAGPVNGIWSLTVTDLRGGNSGMIESFEIQFCDPSGISCSQCVRLGGVINRDTTFACGGDPSLGAIRIFPTYSGAEPDPATFSYLFVVVSKGMIIDITDRPNLESQNRGDYVIYGLSIANIDLPAIDGFIGGSFSNLAGALNAGRLRICAAFSSGFKVYRILSDLDPRTIEERFVCLQSPIHFGSQVITSAGTYEETFISHTGCDSIVELRVVDFNVLQGITNPGTINCANKPLTLNWTNNLFNSDPTYQWFTDDGSILSRDDRAQIFVDLPGTYHLSIAKDGCADTVSAVVTSDGSLPTLQIDDIIMDCSANIGQLRPISDANSFAWTGPNGFTATNQNIDVTEPGTYTITATGNNCAVRKSIQVLADFARPENVSVEGGTIRCANDTVQLSASTSTAGVSYAWIGPDSFSTTVQNPIVTKAGIYTVRIGAVGSGCTVEESVEVFNIYQEPSITITGVTLDCRALAKNISTTVSDNLATFDWTGPNGFRSDAKSPRVTTPGTYKVVITDAQQCTYESMAVVTLDTVRPTVTTADIDLNCMQTDFQLNASYSVLHDASFSWTGPNGFRSNQLDAPATQAGTYRITVRDQVNGCAANSTLQVMRDPMQPELRTENGVINCAQSRDTLVVQASNCSGGCTYSWTGPEGFTSSNDTIIVDQAGQYDVTVTATSGCFSLAKFTVRADTTPLRRDVSVRNVGCTVDGLIQLRNENVFRNYEWIDTLTGNSFVNTASISTTSPTVFRLHSTDVRGCQDTQVYIVGVTDDIPIINIFSDTLNCANDRVPLGISIDNYNNGFIKSYDWTLPDGTKSSANIPTVEQTGSVTVSLEMRNGCKGTATATVTEDFSTPTLEVKDAGFRCSDPGVVLDFNADGQPIATFWSGPNGFRSNDPRPLAPYPGIYNLEIIGSNGCLASDTALIFITDPLPTVEVFGDTVDCLDTLADVGFTTNAAGYSFHWLDPGGRVLNQSLIQTVVPGPYLLELVDSNGCKIIDDVEVVIDTVTFGHQIRSDKIDCVMPTTELILDTVYPFLSYSWVLDSIFVTDVPQPSVDVGGMYILTTQNLNGCTRDIRYQVPADTVRPGFNLKPDTLDCANTRLALQLTNRQGGWGYNWSGPNGFNSNHPSPTIDEPGAYELVVTGTNGCQTERMVVVTSDFDAPALSIRDTFVPCNLDSAQIGITTQDSLPEINWFGPDGFYVQGSKASTRQAGVYYVLAKGTNGCEVLDSLIVSADPILDTVLIDSLHINCRHPEGFLAVSNPSVSYQYRWETNNQTTVDSIVFSTQAGQYVFEALHVPSDCVLRDTFQIRIDTLKPVVSIVEMDSIICEHREIALGSLTDRPVNYNWSTVDGRILGPRDLPEVFLDQPGTYLLSVEDRVNHCFSEDRIEVIERVSNLGDFMVSTQFAGCDGLDDGMIIVDDVAGGTAPFTFSLGGDFFSDRNVYSFLAPGDYLLMVKDANGCIGDSLISLERYPRFTVDLGEELTLNLGDSLALELVTSLPEDQVQQITWYLPDSAVCSDCFQQMVRPLQNSVYFVELVATYGCAIRDTVSVRVFDPGGIFVPNGFTPNGDDVNDHVEVFAGNNIDRIVAFEIFDRWGNNVFSASNYLPGEQIGRWDGRYRSGSLQPGVFTYLVKAVDIRGKPKFVSGDVTLIR